MLTIILLFLGITPTDSTSNFEQLTADYFFNKIWNEKYADYKSIEFENKTDTSIYVGHVYGCRTWTDGEKNEFKNGKTNAQVYINSKPANVSIKKRGNSKRLKLTIGTRIKVTGYYVVQISVYKPLSFVDHYFIKLDKDGQVVDRCEFNEII